MVLFDFEGEDHASKEIGTMQFNLGDSVYDKAWEAYTKVMENRGQEPGDKPEPTALRIALPPST